MQGDARHRHHHHRYHDYRARDSCAPLTLLIALGRNTGCMSELCQSDYNTLIIDQNMKNRMPQVWFKSRLRNRYGYL